MRVLTFRSPTKSLANRIERPSLSFRMSGSCSGYPMLLAERPPIIKLIPPGKISLTADSLWGCRYCLLAASYVSLLTHTYSHLLTPTHTYSHLLTLTLRAMPIQSYVPLGPFARSHPVRKRRDVSHTEVWTARLVPRDGPADLRMHPCLRRFVR